MSVMGFQKKFGWGMGGWSELYPGSFWILEFFNFAKPLTVVDLNVLHAFIT